MRSILLMELAIGSIVYNCIFFKEINSYGSFHVPEHCQHDLIYWQLHWKLFFTKVSVYFYFVDYLFDSGL